MKWIAIGAHLLRDDIEPLTDAVAIGDLFLSALPVPDDQPLGDRDLLVKIAGIRARLLDVATFIAIRYGFSFVSADDAQSKCLGHLTRWKRVLTANRENVEMTLKVAASSPQARPDRHAFASGAEYLRALHAATQSANVDPSFRAAVEQTIVPLAMKHRWSHRDEKSVELTTLIARERLDDVKHAGEQLRVAAPHVPFLLSGPWPLEVFADDDHE